MKRLRQEFKRIWGEIKRIGGHNFTIMMIPHSERKVFSFQISNFIMAFLAMVVLLSGFSFFFYYEWRKAIASNLEEVRRLDSEYRETYDATTKTLREQKKFFKVSSEENLNMLKSLGGSADFVEAQQARIWGDTRETLSEINTKYGLKRHVASANLIDLVHLGKQVEIQAAALKRMQQLLVARDMVIRDLPIRWPLYGENGYKTSPFGIRYSPFEGDRRFHTGVDIAAVPRTPILAAADGVVTFSGVEAGYGNLVIISHNFGYRTFYGHTARNLVYPGQRVRRGDKIALLGMSGRATGYHVHYEVRLQGEPVDPWPYITTEF